MERFAGQNTHGLPEIIDDIQRRKQQMQEELFKYQMQNPPDPYHPESNPTLPDYPGGRPTGTGDWAYNKSEYQNVAALPPGCCPEPAPAPSIYDNFGLVGQIAKNPEENFGLAGQMLKQGKEGNPFGMIGQLAGLG